MTTKGERGLTWMLVAVAGLWLQGAVTSGAQTGACCRPNGLCYITTAANCQAAGNEFLGPGTRCDGAYCPGACDGIVRGDCDRDGRIANFDIDAFVLAVSNPSGYFEQYPDMTLGEYLCRVDINRNGAVNDFDIDGFVACIIEPPPPGESCP